MFGLAFFMVCGLLRMEEDIYELSIGALRLWQAKQGYRSSLDPVLLACFVAPDPRARVLDLGAGNGILPLLLHRLYGCRLVVGIEIQADMVDRAQRNLALNGAQERVIVLCGDVRNIGASVEPGSFDLVVSNPPFRAPGSGRVAPHGERAQARHELNGGLSDFVAAAACALTRGGRLAMIHLAERLPELMRVMSRQGIEPKRLRMIHARQGDDARLVLIEGRLGSRPGLLCEAPLFVYCNNGSGRNYTDEIVRMYQRQSVVS